MERYNGCILVEDASGCRLQLHQYVGRRLFSTLKRYILETGEHVTLKSDGTFVIVNTGETLSPVTADL